MRDSGYGQHDAGWLSFYEFFRDACGMDEETQKLAGLWLLCKSAGWFLPHKNICWICERHNVLNRDEGGRLHCETGPALSYSDGWSIYAIDGIRLDEQIIIRPETQTVQQLNGEENGDIRTIRINRFGWTRYLKESGARQLDVRDNEIEGTIESLYVTDRGERRLVATCPSGKIAVMGVPSSVATCEQAANYLIPFTRITGLPKARILART